MGSGSGGAKVDAAQVIDHLISSLKYIKENPTKITKLETDFSCTHLHIDIELEQPNEH